MATKKKIVPKIPQNARLSADGLEISFGESLTRVDTFRPPTLQEQVEMAFRLGRNGPFSDDRLYDGEDDDRFDDHLDDVTPEGMTGHELAADRDAQELLAWTPPKKKPKASHNEDEVTSSEPPKGGAKKTSKAPPSDDEGDV